MISKKICLVGDFSVGKTSLIRRFVDRQFSDRYLSTVGVKISKKQVEVSGDSPEDAKTVQLLIWDLEGSTKFKGIAPNYLQGARGAIVVGDVTRPETIENLPERIELFCSVNPTGSIIVALNKSDLVEADQLQKARDRCQPLQEKSAILDIYTTSAKTGENVDEIFHQLAGQAIAIGA